MDYIDFYLKISAGSRKNRYVITARSDVAGEAKSDFILPLKDEQLELFILKVGATRRGVRHIQSPEWVAAQGFGSKLFQSIFNNDISTCFAASRNHAVSNGKGLRLKITLDAPKLSNYPWEFLYDPTHGRFLCLFEETPIIRYIELLHPIVPLCITPPLRILCVAASPMNYGLLDTNYERQKLKQALKDLLEASLVQIDWLPIASLDVLQSQLLNQTYHIFHFIGHGGFDEIKQDGILVFEDEGHSANQVSGERLAVLLGNHPSLRLAVLNACEGARTSDRDPFAGVAMTLARTGNLPAVVAMQFEITDKAAIDFAHGFYSAIAAGRSIDAAVGQGRQKVFAQNNDVEWATPVLYLRAADGKIFDIDLDYQERLAKERAEQERLAKERAEQERLAKEHVEQKRLSKERIEQERLAKERAEQEQLAKERDEQERLAKEHSRQTGSLYKRWAIPIITIIVGFLLVLSIVIGIAITQKQPDSRQSSLGSSPSESIKSIATNTITAVSTPRVIVARTLVPTSTPYSSSSAASSTASSIALPVAKVSTLTINLKKGVKWSDGTTFSSKDVVGTWNIMWMQSSGSWNSLEDIVAKDDNMVEFQILTGSPAILDQIVRAVFTRPYSVYSKWMDAAAAFRKANADRKGADVTKTLDEMNAFRPANPVVYGPYTIDPKSVTEAQMTMVKNPTGWNADKIDFDKVTIYWGDTVQDMPLYLSGDMDYSSNAYSPANLQTLRALGSQISVLGGPGTNGPGMYFNNDVYPLNKKEVRQAFAYAIDRVQNCTVAFGDACRPVKYEAGFTDAAVPTWLSAAQVAKLNTYDYNPAKAEALLTGLGFKKGSDGIWVDDKGKPMAYELIVPADFTEYLASSENVAQQLTKFGIKVTVKPYQSSERGNVHKAGAYQISMDIGFRFTYFHPYVSFDYSLRPGIVAVGNKNDPTAAAGSRGMNFPWDQTTPDGKKINLNTWIDKMAEGFDPEVQKPYVADVVSVFNDQLPVLAMFERYLTDPIDTKTRVTGWLPATDKIYNNNQNNSPVAMQFIGGTLKPSTTNKAKEFKTSYPYVQPPKGHYNAWATDSNVTVAGIGGVIQPFMYPPFTWYDVNVGKYVPFFADSWSIK